MRQKDGRLCSFLVHESFNHWRDSKKRGQIIEHVKSAVPMMSTIISQVWKGDGGFGETSQCTGAGSASGSRPAQLIGDLRES